MNSLKTFVLYHAHCADGFGAAFAAWCALGDTAEYLPVSYGEPFPEIPDGSVVFILDFSWPDNARARDALLALNVRMTRLVVLDHHKTAEAALEGLDFAVFDMEHSGAWLAWEFFRGMERGICFGEVPDLLRYVEDRDLWKWELPKSREVSAALQVVPRTFVKWLELTTRGMEAIWELQDMGKALLEGQAVQVDALCKRAHMHPVNVPGEDDPETVLAVNTPLLQSEVLHELLQRNPSVQMVAAYFDRDWCTRIWSLRSRAGCDCSVLAKRMGGGGHAQAAGFQTLNIVEAKPLAKSEAEKEEGGESWQA